MAPPAIVTPGNIQLMEAPRWSDVQDAWEPEGSLRDVYVHGTTQADWQAVIDVIRSEGWPMSYSEDGEPRAMPDAVGKIFERGSRVAIFWAIKPRSGIQINCHFFGLDEIEFDLAPTEIVGQEELDVVVGFVRLIGRASGKPASVCYENSPNEPFMVYDPTTDRVTVFKASL